MEPGEGAPAHTVFEVRGGVPIRRALGWVLVGALCVAAATASWAILSGSFSDADWRVIGTSIGFAVFSSTAAAGTVLRVTAADSRAAVGSVAVALSTVSFLLLVLALWVTDTDSAWRAFGASTIASLGASHASLVLRARRPDDSDLVAGLASVSILLGALDTVIGVLPIAGWADVSEGYAQVVAVLVIGLLLTTALPPILRRLQRSRAHETASGSVKAGVTERAPVQCLAEEMLAAAERIEEATREPAVRAETARLRTLARSLFD